MGAQRTRVLTDAVATTWTIIIEMEVESVDTYFAILEGRSKSPDLADTMKGYTEIINGGRREIFRVA